MYIQPSDDESSQQTEQKLRFASDGTFRITVFSDTHFGEGMWHQPLPPKNHRNTQDLVQNKTASHQSFGAQNDAQSVEVMRKVLKAENQQLVVLNGDLITGDDAISDKVTDFLDQIVAPINEAGLPWASTYGNHDNQPRLLSKNIFKREKTYKNSLTQSMVPNSSEFTGVTNYYLPVYAASGPQTIPALILWFFDSRGGFRYGTTQSKANARPEWVDKSVRLSVTVSAIPSDNQLSNRWWTGSRKQSRVWVSNIKQLFLHSHFSTSHCTLHMRFKNTTVLTTVKSRVWIMKWYVLKGRRNGWRHNRMIRTGTTRSWEHCWTQMDCWQRLVVMITKMIGEFVMPLTPILNRSTKLVLNYPTLGASNGTTPFPEGLSKVTGLIYAMAAIQDTEVMETCLAAEDIYFWNRTPWNARCRRGYGWKMGLSPEMWLWIPPMDRMSTFRLDTLTVHWQSRIWTAVILQKCMRLEFWWQLSSIFFSDDGKAKLQCVTPSTNTNISMLKIAYHEVGNPRGSHWVSLLIGYSDNHLTIFYCCLLFKWSLDIDFDE